MPQDPLFFFHHANLDRIRLQWQRRNAPLRPFAYHYPVAENTAALLRKQRLSEDAGKPAG